MWFKLKKYWNLYNNQWQPINGIHLEWIIIYKGHPNVYFHDKVMFKNEHWISKYLKS